MIQMVKVLEADRPALGYVAEIPGRPGRFVSAVDIPELRRKLRAAVTNPEASSFKMESSPRPKGYSETALFVTL